MRIALDAMGGDHAPAAEVEGAVLYVRKAPQDTVVLVGDRARIEAELARLGASDHLEIEHASEVVSMDEPPGKAVRRKQRSSIRVCLELVKRGAVGAAVSAGSSGAAMAAALFVLGRLEGVERPAIVSLLPTGKGRMALLIDSGANTVCRPAHLVQFAYLGDAYARCVLSIPRPRVALLSNGAEPGKGTELTRKAMAALENGDLNFSGYVEGNDLFAGEVDVIVTDGFTGNVALKTTEGAAAALGTMLQREIQARAGARLGALLMAPAFAAFRRILDWAEYGGAPLVGVNGVVTIAHGRSRPRAIRSALRAAARAATLGISEELKHAAMAARELSMRVGLTALQGSNTQ
jgi:glycerol-3-phosphate acyltransferase PlsX